MPIEYGADHAVAFSAHRELPAAGMLAWRDAVEHHLHPEPGLRVLDLGAGTGLWTRAFAEWFPVEVVAVEPSAAMRDRAVVSSVLTGDATCIPLPDASVDAAWLSTVIHHIPDLAAAAAELRRVVRPCGPVLARSVFPEHCDRIGLFRYWPEAATAIADWPSIADVQLAFSAAGFPNSTVQGVRQLTASSMEQLMSQFSRDAHTPLRLIDDAAFVRGLARAHQAATEDHRPVIDEMDLLTLR